jgi:predicted PurR-regulated permease PerM
MTQPQTSPRPYDFDRVVRALIAAGVIVAIVWLLRFLSDVLLPFAVAVLLAYLINPIVCFLERKLHSRTAATLVTVFGCLAAVMLLVAVLLPRITRETSDFGRMVRQLRSEPTTTRSAVPLRERFSAYIESQHNELFKGFLIKLRQTLGEIDYGALAVEAGRRVAPGLWGLVSGVLSFLLGLAGLVIVLLYLIFVSIDYAHLSADWPTYLPPKHRDRIVAVIEEFSLAMSRYFRGQFIIASIVGVLFAIGFWLIGLRMGILLGLFIGALNMVPYLQAVGMVPAVMLGVVRAVEHDTSVFWSVVLVLLVFAIVQTLQDGLLTPWIMGKQTGLRPLWLLLSIFIWGKLLGFLGLVLAIPLTCLASAWYRRLVLGQKEARAIADAPPP